MSGIARRPQRAASTLPSLRRGSTGAAVRELQRKLRRLGYLNAADAATGPGVFGPRTERAVLAFQADHGLKRSGVVGAWTQAALARALEGATDFNAMQADGFDARRPEVRLHA